MPDGLNGTRVDLPASGGSDVSVRKATMSDIPGLLSIINSYAAGGVMLPRTEFEMAENIRDFSVIEMSGELAGCGAIHFYTPRSAEIRSLAIAPQFQGFGAGKFLIAQLEEEARSLRVYNVFAFTYIPEFFRKLGFSQIERGELPLKAWKDCLRCPKFQCCDEIAVIKRLCLSDVGVMDILKRGIVDSRPASAKPAVLLPVLRNPR